MSVMPAMPRALQIAAVLAVLTFTGSSFAAISPELGSEAAKKLSAIDEGTLPSGQRVELSNDEINSFLFYEFRDQRPEGLKSLEVRMLEGVAVAKARVDLLAMQQGQGQRPNFLIRALLSGERTLLARVSYEGSRGMAVADLVSLDVDGVTMEGSILRWLVDNVIQPNMGEFRFGEPSPLPENIDSVDLEPGRAIITARP